MQHTVKSKITFKGVGLHSGHDVNMTLYPAEAGHGIVFVRTDITDGRDTEIQARWDNVVDTKLCTVIGNDDGATVGTIEHLMAALRGCAVDNVRIEIDGPEVPVMDGSSAEFVNSIDEIGVTTQKTARSAIRVLKDVSVEIDGKKVTLKPAKIASFSGFIDFDHPVIGNQKYEIKMLNGNFRHDLADARTFGFAHEVEALRKMGLALGGSLDNAIVLDTEKVLNAQGLRYNDEFIRHKLLDAIGDLYLAGAPLLAAYEGEKSSHDLNNKLLHALFADDSAWEIADFSAD